ncbi:MAG: hypothetical protein IPG98_06400 [Burkholderiales bacterium]|nr:hypothetical protein [Burkholderiales bacterium]MBK8666539.1 hypothetical protein [Burkholderiales bacterium]
MPLQAFSLTQAWVQAALGLVGLLLAWLINRPYSLQSNGKASPNSNASGTTARGAPVSPPPWPQARMKSVTRE